VADEATPDGTGALHDLVVIGASAGGVETLRRVVSGLPEQFAAAVCIVLHIAPDSPSVLAGILARSGPLPCTPASDGDPLSHGQILVAPPDRHLTIEDDHVHLTVGPRENGHRPAVDVLFRSAALAKGGRVIGVILSGTRGDGAAGLAAVKSHGGATIVQDPSEALYSGMPTTALAHVAVDAVVPSELVAATIVAMVNGEDPPPSARENRPELGPSANDPATTVCPECGGVLSERSQAGMAVWECRVGHRYSPEGLVDAQADDIESAMWAAVRALEDRSRLLNRLADQFDAQNQARSARSFRSRAASAQEQAITVRDALAHAAETALRKLSDAEAERVASNGGGE
jgi:two-component system chemotaxis response regulator CheB